MKLKSEKGFTGIDIAISIVVLFIFVSLIASLIYNYNVSSKEATRKSTALELAINEIGKIKNEEFETYKGLNISSTMENNVEIEGNKGFFKTIEIMDYKDLEGKEKAISDIVKKVTVKISYMSNGKEENVELSTILTKEN